MSRRQATGATCARDSRERARLPRAPRHFRFPAVTCLAGFVVLLAAPVVRAQDAGATADATVAGGWTVDSGVAADQDAATSPPQQAASPSDPLTETAADPPSSAPTPALAVSPEAAPEEAAAVQIDSRGELGLETRVFWPDGDALTKEWNVAMVGRLHVNAAAGRLTSKARMFVRHDQQDRERSVLIPEELWLDLDLSPLRLRAGYQMLNWTATEAFHPADVLNSRYFDSAIENPEKLGEPMVSARLEIPHGSVEAMFMPVFVEPIFPSRRSRQRFAPPGVALGEPIVIGRGGDMVSGSGPYRFAPQGALRLQQTWGSADIGLHGIAHVDRSYPYVIFDPASNLPRAVFLPVIQTGATYQQAAGAWLMKLELAYRWYQRPSAGTLPEGVPPVPDRDHFLGAAGLEYSLPHGGGSESTLLLEGQLFVPRDRDVPRVLAPLFQHDVLLGIRHALNDESSRTVTAVVIVDVVRPQEIFASASYGQRLGETWGLAVGVRFVRIPPRDPATPAAFEWLDKSHQAYANLLRHF